MNLSRIPTQSPSTTVAGFPRLKLILSLLCWLGGRARLDSLINPICLALHIPMFNGNSRNRLEVFILQAKLIPMRCILIKQHYVSSVRLIGLNQPQHLKQEPVHVLNALWYLPVLWSIHEWHVGIPLAKP